MTAPFLAWCMVFAGVATALVLGWRASEGFLATLGVLFADALMGVALSFVLYFIFSLCFRAGFCVQTDDHTVWSLAFPVIFVPAYWLATLLAKASRFWKTCLE